MTNKDYLLMYGVYQGKIKKAVESLQSITESIDSLSVNYSGMPRSNGISNKPEQYIIDLERAVESRQHNINYWRNEMTKIEDAILAIGNPKYSTLLWERYINGKDWETIAMIPELSYSVDHIRSRLHGQALLELKQPGTLHANTHKCT